MKPELMNFRFFQYARFWMVALLSLCVLNFSGCGSGENETTELVYDLRALMNAIKISDQETIRAELAAGADPNGIFEDGYTALMNAAAIGNPAVVRMLLEAGATPNLMPPDMNSAMHIAAQAGHIEVLKVLLDAGADINLLSPHNATPAQFAEMAGKFAARDYLQSRGGHL